MHPRPSPCIVVCFAHTWRDPMENGQNTAIELFAGVGGFTIGLSNAGWDVIWANQWEPNKKRQWAFECYDRHFKDSTNLNVDIATVDASDIPDHELLCGGFPCQNYSVASTLSSSKGIQGGKGVLWWEIDRIVEAKRPRFILLENVDRLLRSPANQRGRDFGIMLACLYDLGYSVEWRVINAAESYDDLFVKETSHDVKYISDTFKFDFKNSGYCSQGLIRTLKVEPDYDKSYLTLGDFLQRGVEERYYITEEEEERLRYLKGAKRLTRRSKDGYDYIYSEGAIPFPDPLDRPSRTMLTSEGSISRTSHFISDPETGRIRRLTPVECEKLNGFPADWTKDMPENMRYFCMGNALMVGLVQSMGHRLQRIKRLV